LARFTGNKTVKFRIPHFTDIYVRPGQSDIAAVRKIFAMREYDTEHLGEPNRRIASRYAEIVNSGKVPVVVDAGANVGAAAIWFRSKYPKAYVVAIEPDTNNLDVLRLNANADDHISVIEAGVGAASGFGRLQEGKFGWETRIERASCGVPIVSMNEAFAIREKGVPFIAKIDIEGFELDLFLDNLEWLNSVFVVMIEPHDWMLPGKKTSRSFQIAMAKHEFELFISGENLVYIRA
jgi:FkbM family methyltransferase